MRDDADLLDRAFWMLKVVLLWHEYMIGKREGIGVDESSAHKR